LRQMTRRTPKPSLSALDPDSTVRSGAIDVDRQSTHVPARRVPKQAQTDLCP
jgi:hypothetical protein